MKKGKQKIVDAAFKVILQKGIKEASVRDIAKEAGISVGTFTYHYPNKEELLFDLFEMTNAKQDALLEKAFKSQTLEEKKKALELVLREATFNEYFMKLNYYLLGEAFAQNTQMLEKMKQKYAQWRQEFKRYLYGELEEVGKEKEINASLMIAILDGMTIQCILDEQSVDLSEVVNKVMDIMYS